MNTAPTTPFSYQFSKQFPALLQKLNISLALSTYQAGKLIFISPKDEHALVQLPRSFKKAMGIAVQGDRMALAGLDEITVFGNVPELAYHYPKKPNVYDALFMPRASYFTGALDIHDLEWGKDGLYAVNTSFSCICKIDMSYNFTPVWQPPFISALAAEDRCHLNGMAMRNGLPAYASAFNTGNSKGSWRENITKTGVIIDIESNEVIADSLAMPHSPRLYPEGLFVLLSAKGELLHINPGSGEQKTVIQYPGFLRGMDRHGDFLFIGVSKIRQSSKTFAKINDSLKASAAGILVVHLPTAKLVAQLAYQASVDEIYDVKVLPNLKRPNILNTMSDDYKKGLSIPSATYWAQ